MTDKKFLKTIRVEDLKNILDSIPKINLEVETIILDQTFNRVLSEDVVSNIDVPHFRKSRMDGYAVIAEDTFKAEEDNIIPLKLIETIRAGEKPQKKLKSGQCLYVATGAAIPDGANGVVMIEFTEKKDNEIYISKAITPGTHIVNIGHDIKKGQIIVSKNSLIDLPTIGVLASCGIEQVKVYKKPIVSLMSTGDELVSLNIKELEIGKIYDVNSSVLKKAIENTGAEVKFLGIIEDKLEILKETFDLALKNSDIIILTGGTSKGEGDLGPKMLEEYKDIEILVHGVRMKPGKPIIFCKIKNKIIFILPGYPTSALSCYYVFIEDFLRRMSGLSLKEKNSKEYEVAERIYSTVGRHEFKTVKIKEFEGVKKILPVQTGSEAISTMFYADGYIEIEELEAIVEKGDKKRVYFF
ncbi:MAG: gephyrin-like molybdotransferase Glp [Promethearchaeota archaeon]